MARQISYYAGGHTPRTFVDHVEIRAGSFRSPRELRTLAGYENAEGRMALARISVFLISTYDTDYLLLKADTFSRAVDVLRSAGYDVA